MNDFEKDAKDSTSKTPTIPDSDRKDSSSLLTATATQEKEKVSAEVAYYHYHIFSIFLSLHSYSICAQYSML